VELLLKQERPICGVEAKQQYGTAGTATCESAADSAAIQTDHGTGSLEYVFVKLCMNEYELLMNCAALNSYGVSKKGLIHVLLTVLFV
jgi:hypothetical protein